MCEAPRAELGTGVDFLLNKQLSFSFYSYTFRKLLKITKWNICAFEASFCPAYRVPERAFESQPCSGF
jgi:hypothetical protein